MINCTFENGRVIQLRHVVVDALIIQDKKVLLTQRQADLSEGGKWCLPGGYVDKDETTIEAVIREVHEEIGFTSNVQGLLTVRDNPHRRNDTRQNISFVFLVELIAKVALPDPAEVQELKWWPLDALPSEADMAFDHHEIIWEWMSEHLDEVAPAWYNSTVMAETYTIPVAVQRLIRQYKQTSTTVHDDNVPRFKVGEAVGRVAFVYEKLRNALEYREENLLVKSAILRILKRRFVPGVDPASITRPLLTELIHAGYIKNNSLPEAKLDDVSKILVKYARFLAKAIPTLNQEDRERTFDWAVMLSACEVEETISSVNKQRAMIEFMYVTLLERIDIASKTVTEDERKVQIYLAVLRGYARYDVDLTQYHLLKFFYPDWLEHKEDTINRVARNVLNVEATLSRQITFPTQEPLLRQVKKISALFVILQDVMNTAEDPMALFQNPAALEEAIIEETNKAYKKVKVKLRRTSVRSIIYLFVTKMLVAFITEVPYDYIFFGHINYIPLYINLIFHPTLLFFIALLIHIPAKENTKKIVEGINHLIYNFEGKEITYKIRGKAKRGGFTDLVFRGLYLFAFIITFGVLFILLAMLNFNIMSGLIFVMFLTLVSFFGLRVRQIAKDLVVLDHKDNLISAIIDFFSIPIVRAGQWLSINFARINIFVFVLDLIIEAPFKLIIVVFEEWLSYMREKREEIYDN